MVLERTYIIPLRREWLKVPRYKRAKKASTAVREFLAKHMKLDNVKIGNGLNMELWKHGMKNPPHKIKVSVIKEDDGTVKAELFGKKYIEHKAPEKKDEETGMAGKLKSMLGSDKKKEAETEEKTEHKEAKKEEYKHAEKKEEHKAKLSEKKTVKK
ncbi:MAG: 50S ribosomal protein L31e [Candidatus Woesearchaeota archaeon]|nr:50S ribosomal protein L31e [Candidatus Woesearchaeota archaeon]